MTWEAPSFQNGGLEVRPQVFSEVDYRGAVGGHLGGIQTHPRCPTNLITGWPEVVRVMDYRGSQVFSMIDYGGATDVQRGSYWGPQVVDYRGGPRCSRWWITGWSQVFSMWRTTGEAASVQHGGLQRDPR